MDLATAPLALPAPARTRTAAVLGGINLALLGLAGGFVTLISLLPLAMSGDACSSATAGEPICTGLPQLAAFALLVLGLAGGLALAAVGLRRRGRAAAALAAAGWLVWISGLAAAIGLLALVLG